MGVTAGATIGAGCGGWRGFTVTMGVATRGFEGGASGAAGCVAESSSHIGLSTDAKRSASSAVSGDDAAGACGDAAPCRPSELPLLIAPDSSGCPFDRKR